MAEFFPESYWAADFWQGLFWPSIGVTYPGKAGIGISGCCPGMAVAAVAPSIGFTAGTPAITIQGV